MKRLVAAMILLGCALHGTAQNKYTGFPSMVWPKLYDIKFEKAKDNLGEYQKPVFSAAVKALNGKVVALPGYMIPFEGGSKGTKFMFSSMPLNACFFCGVGGPESVIEVNTKQPLSFHDKPIEIKGILRLNDTDPDKMIYILEQAEFVDEVGL
ncbi:unnamed protein product [Phaeothamnion confervicola]